jgi:uncharacterized protein YndB with AHSA1/START domain
MSEREISDDAVSDATGAGWEAWFRRLDEWGAAEKGHKATAAHLADEYDLSGWWSQSVTVEYERERGLREVGETEQGFQMGARKTFLPDAEAAWELITSAEGLQTWLGEGAPTSLEEGDTGELDDGTTYEIRVVEPGSHVRLRWHPPKWDDYSTVQVRAIESSSGRGCVAIHHEQLPSQDARKQMKKHWRSVLSALRAP